MDKNIILGTTIEKKMKEFDEVHNQLKEKVSKMDALAEVALKAAIEYEHALEQTLETVMIDYENTLQSVLEEVNSEYPTDIEELHDLILQQQSVLSA